MQHIHRPNPCKIQNDFQNYYHLQRESTKSDVHFLWVDLHSDVEFWYLPTVCSINHAWKHNIEASSYHLHLPYLHHLGDTSFAAFTAACISDNCSPRSTLAPRTLICEANTNISSKSSHSKVVNVGHFWAKLSPTNMQLKRPKWHRLCRAQPALVNHEKACSQMLFEKSLSRSDEFESCQWWSRNSYAEEFFAEEIFIN